MRVETLSISELRAEQRRLAAEIERREIRQAAQAESDPEADERVPEKGGVAGR